MLVQEPEGRAFAARDLLGGDNYFWQDTPMMALFEYYRNGDDANNEYAVEEAGKATGRLLYQLLYDDKREFETWVSTRECTDGQVKKIMDIFYSMRHSL